MKNYNYKSSHTNPLINGKRICIHCGEDKLIDDFGLSNRYIDGKSPVCKKCNNDRLGKAAKYKIDNLTDSYIKGRLKNNGVEPTPENIILHREKIIRERDLYKNKNFEPGRLYKCCACRKDKSADNFHKNKNTWNLLCDTCKDCMAEKSKKYVKELDDTYLKQSLNRSNIQITEESIGLKRNIIQLKRIKNKLKNHGNKN